MDLVQIRYFLALAATFSFTKAAEQCGVTQPTLSRAIKALEDELGGELIRRERGRTHLTELGRIVLPRMEQAASLAETVKLEAAQFTKLSTTSLRLGVMCTIGPIRLVPIVSHLTTRVPQLKLELLEASGERIVEMLTGGEIDVALVGLPSYPEAVAIKPLYDERYVVAFPRGHRFERMEQVPVCLLTGEPYLERMNCEYVVHYEASGSSFVFEPDIRYRSEHEDWIQAMIIAGMGCACMPEYMPLLPDLLRRPLCEPAISRTIVVATVRGRRHTPAVELFSRLCAEFHREHSH